MRKNKLLLLIKHGFLENYKEVLISNLFLFSSFIICSLFYVIAPYSFIISPFGIVLSGSIITLVILAIIFTGIILLINIFKTMYQKLFTREGYLTFTLPVSIDHLILSKVIINLIWIVISIFTILFGFFIFNLCIMIKNYNLYDINIGLFNGILSEDFNYITILKYIVYFINTILGLLVLLLALAISNTLAKSKIFISIFLFLSIYLIYSLVIGLVNNLVGFGFYNLASGIMFGHNDFNSYIISVPEVIINIGLIFASYFLAKNIIKNKLEVL